MIERSATRRELEASLRSLMPAKGTLLPDDSNATTAAAGVGGLLVGFVWGWARGRRSRRSRRRA